MRLPSLIPHLLYIFWLLSPFSFWKIDPNPLWMCSRRDLAVFVTFLFSTKTRFLDFSPESNSSFAFLFAWFSSMYSHTWAEPFFLLNYDPCKKNEDLSVNKVLISHLDSFWVAHSCFSYFSLPDKFWISLSYLWKCLFFQDLNSIFWAVSVELTEE